MPQFVVRVNNDLSRLATMPLLPVAACDVYATKFIQVIAEHDKHKVSRAPFTRTNPDYFGQVSKDGWTPPSR